MRIKYLGKIGSNCKAVTPKIQRYLALAKRIAQKYPIAIGSTPKDLTAEQQRAANVSGKLRATAHFLKIKELKSRKIKPV